MGFYLERYSAIGAFENSVYDGVFEALDRLRAEGARLFVATSKNEKDARAIVEHFGLASHFETVNGARADGSRSAKRELISDILAAHGFAREEAAMVGDRKFDMIGAKEVGVAAVGALWGYGSRSELAEAGAEEFAGTPGEAAEIALRL